MQTMLGMKYNTDNSTALFLFYYANVTTNLKNYKFSL